jgi:hypothetical protein
VGLAFPRLGGLALIAGDCEARHGRCLAPQSVPGVLDLEDPERSAGATVGSEERSRLEWVAIYTAPGVNPAYLSLEVSLIGTGGIPFTASPQETGPGRAILGGTFTTRLRIEALTTDPSRAVEISALDYTSSGGPPVTERSMAENWPLSPTCRKIMYRSRK